MPANTVEELIADVLKGETQKNALDFIAFLKASDIPFNYADNFLDVHLQGRNVCSVLITGSDEKPGPWTIWSEQEPGTWVTWPDGEQGDACRNVSVDERTKENAWANVNYCANCGGDCAPGKRKTVLGKAYDGLCSSALSFTDPDAAMLDCAKKMVEARRNDILRA